jgi:hypothetical protein
MVVKSGYGLRPSELVRCAGFSEFGLETSLSIWMVCCSAIARFRFAPKLHDTGIAAGQIADRVLLTARTMSTFRSVVRGKPALGHVDNPPVALRSILGLRRDDGSARHAGSATTSRRKACASSNSGETPCAPDRRTAAPSSRRCNSKGKLLTNGASHGRCNRAAGVIGYPTFDGMAVRVSFTTQIEGKPEGVFRQDAATGSTP